MGFFDRFRRAAIALDFGHSVPDPSILAFPSIDIERTQDNLRLVDMGKERGSRNMPAHDSQGMDDVEHKIVTEIDQKKNLAFNNLSGHQRAYRDRITGLAHRSELEQLNMAVDSAMSDFAAKKQTAKNDIYPMRIDVIEHERDLNAFRQKHRLTRPSRRPESRLWCWGVLLMIGLLEAIMNGAFFARGDELGFLGGLSKAVVAAFLNVSIGWILGRFLLPNVFHRNWLRKFVGLVFSLGFIALIPAFNLLVAHYRAALGGDAPELADQAALTSFLASPFYITEVQGWILFGLGLTFSLIAAGDGWYYDDPYPGYGAAIARHRNALLDYTEAMETAIDEVNDIRDHAEKTVSACSQNIGTRENQFHMLMDETARMSRLFEEHLVHLENAGNALLGVYRNENAKWRTEPVPAYFSIRWTLSRPNNEPLFQASDSIRDAISSTVADAPAESKAAREKLHAAYREAIHEHERIDQLTEADLVNAAR